ncbi:MAG: C-terminal target protein [Bacteroidetes bacterium]|jgi:gliding motility-associated-like protein|nr:C-terminal target protein [Bacteroidota bacterium]
MKRSLLLNLEESQSSGSRYSTLYRIIKSLSWIIPFAFISSIYAQNPCASINLTYTVTSPKCFGSTNGTINVTMSGGTAPYSFVWSNGSLTEDLSGLSAGTYTVIATDMTGCMDTAMITLYQPAPLLNTLDPHNVLCHGGFSGYILTNVTGGTSPYNYYWSSGSQSANAAPLTAGTYIVTVVDYRGCSRKDTAVITQPDALSLQLTSPEHNNGFNVSSYMGTDGSIDLAVNGGVAPYTYSWSNSATSQDLTSLNANTYSVVVLDANGCSANGSIVLDQPFIVEMPTGFTPNSDGANDNFLVHGAEAFPDNTLTIYNRWGNVVYQKSNYTNQWNGYNNKGDELPDGTYFAIFEMKSEEKVLKGYVEMKRH